MIAIKSKRENLVPFVRMFLYISIGRQWNGLPWDEGGLKSLETLK